MAASASVSKTKERSNFELRSFRITGEPAHPDPYLEFAIAQRMNHASQKKCGKQATLCEAVHWIGGDANAKCEMRYAKRNTRNSIRPRQRERTLASVPENHICTMHERFSPFCLFVLIGDVIWSVLIAKTFDSVTVVFAEMFTGSASRWSFVVCPSKHRQLLARDLLRPHFRISCDVRMLQSKRASIRFSIVESLESALQAANGTWPLFADLKANAHAPNRAQECSSNV